ncbi:hypothetical protein EON80_00700 [bacterium]|nr:MAG: hypothetical protein EON80_00700 [bacterium]
MPATFTEYFAQLNQRTPELFPTQSADASLSQDLLAADLFPGKSGEWVEICRAGLLLWNDDLENSHPIAQDIENQTGSFWHAIIHRRESDFSNARYWWARTGEHPVFDEICDLVLHRIADFPFLDELRGSGNWEPVAFTDFCQRAKRSGEHTEALAEVQRLEMRVLLEWCASQVK